MAGRGTFSGAFFRHPRTTFGTVGAACALLVAGAGFYRAQERELRSQVERELTAIARLEADQVSDWRQELVDEALELMERPMLRDRVRAWLRSGAPCPLPADVALELEAIVRHDGLETIRVVGRDGREPCAPSPGHVYDLRWAAAAQPMPTELHLDPGSDAPHVGILVPLLEGPNLAGGLLLTSDARQVLDRILRGWPVSRERAESYLVRREGDSALVLTERRNIAGAALRMRRPIGETTSPAVAAVLGHVGFFEGVDARGVRVLSALQPVSGSRWYLVASVDEREAMAAWRTRSWLIVALVAAALAITLSSAFAVVQRSQKLRVQALYEAETARARAGAALAESERRYRLLSEGAREYIYWIDEEGRLRYASPACQALFGCSPQELLDDPSRRTRLVHPDDRDLLAEHAAAAGPGPCEIFYRVVVPDAVRWIEHHCQPISDGAGLPMGRRGTERDVTRRRQAEEAAAERNVLRQVLIDESTDGIVLVDDEHGILEANAAFARMLGYSREELTGLRTWQYDALLDEAAVRAAFPDVASIRRRFETRHRRRDGSEYDVEVSAAGVRLGGRAAVLAICRDISERKRAEAELRESEATYASLFHGMLNGFAHCRMIEEPGKALDFVYLKVNETFGRLTGLTGVEGRRVSEVIPGIQEADPELLARYSRVARDGAPERFEVHVAALKMWFSISAYRPRPGEFVTLFDVITAHKDAERERERLAAQLAQSQKLESVGRLAGGVAHDFNNMLGVILGHAELGLARPQVEGKLRHDLEQIRDAARRSSDLTRQLLAFARKQAVSPRVLDPNETIGNMLRMLQRLLGEEVELAWLPGSGAWPVRVDPAQIDQVLANLAVNARDAMNGPGRLTISTANVALPEAAGGDLPGDYVQISVSDTGCGMPPEVLEHVFEPFFTTKELGKGTGLGLAMVYGIARQNEGFVTAESAPGAGSTFRVHLPRWRESAPDAQPEAADLARGHGERVLVVEDEPALLSLVEAQLLDLGYAPLLARSPSEAEEIASGDGPIDLLLTDVVMPGSNGRELARRLERRRPGLRCLFMSGYTGDVVAHRGVLDEGLRFLQKPFSHSDLAAKVRAALDEAR